MKKMQQGFTLIELMIVVAIIGILAAVALPAYQDYTIRSQASEGLTLMSGAKAAVAETFINRGAWPADREGAGMSADATDTNGQYVESVDVAEGVITATYGANANAKIDQETLVLTPWETPDGSVAWQCNSATAGPEPENATAGAGGSADLGTLPAQYAPAQCRT
ncbi:MAG: pilin [Thauera sp.]|nr:pilin [Thauera sp.]